MLLYSFMGFNQTQYKVSLMKGSKFIQIKDQVL